MVFIILNQSGTFFVTLVRKTGQKTPGPLKQKRRYAIDFRSERTLSVGTASAASLAPAQARRKKDFRYAQSRVFSSRCSHWSRRSALQSIKSTLYKRIIGYKTT
ncbi:hypothetical protein [Psychrobacillus antarcticus]|uniref:hypothetical protein n=1 Tax=Psychrobacillus antarcticus TaxID=2879115 RepID=UPI002407CAA9|nr:hypothetical protein [Psychrobacillus antarcticus]